MFIMVGRDVLYQSGMETAEALDSLGMHEQAEMRRSLAEKMRSVEMELETLIAESR
jgi:hypothetical protein